MMGPENFSRRTFVRAAAGFVPGLAMLSTACGPQGSRKRSSSALFANPDLPPPVIALRSLGGSFRFDPIGLQVSTGTTLRWLNMGDFHTTTAFHPDNGGLIAADVPLRIPEGAPSWHSGMLGLTGTEFEYTTDIEGVYDYFCQPHYSFGMVGRLIVGESLGESAETRPLAELIDAAQKNMPSVGSIVGDAGHGLRWAARTNGVLWERVHSGDVVRKVDALREGIGMDLALATQLDASGTGQLAMALEEFVSGIKGTLGYEALVIKADALKSALLAGKI